MIVVSPHRTAPAALGEALVPADGTDINRRQRLLSDA